MAFNEECVANAIYNSRIPIISAVGHEIDFTIADFVADLRAPTPTGAAEMAVPNITDLNILLKQYSLRLTNNITSKLDYYNDKLNRLKKSYVLENPRAIYEIKEERLSNLITYFNNYITKLLELKQTKYKHLQESYILNHPEDLFINEQNKYNLYINKLELLNPLNILSKGYSVVTKDDKIIKNTKNIKVNDKINIKLSDGSFEAKVEKVG